MFEEARIYGVCIKCEKHDQNCMLVRSERLSLPVYCRECAPPRPLNQPDLWDDLRDLITQRLKTYSKDGALSYGEATVRYVCPISGCEKAFASGRLGWDGHVGSPRIHPDWHPDVQDPEERKALFRQESADWLPD